MRNDGGSWSTRVLQFLLAIAILKVTSKSTPMRALGCGRSHQIVVSSVERSSDDGRRQSTKESWGPGDA